MLLLCFGDDDPVGHDVVHIGRAHRAGKAEIVDLDGSRPARQDLRPRTGGEASQIDEDLDVELAYQLDHVLVGKMADVFEALECCLQAVAHLAAVIRSVGDGADFEALAVVLLENSGHQMRDGVIAKIGRHVPDPQPGNR